MEFNENQTPPFNPRTFGRKPLLSVRAAALFITLFALFPATSVAQHSAVDLTVLADGHMRLPLTYAARAYTSEGNGSVTLWFADTNAMTDAIADGADADMIITADAKALKTLEQTGQIDVYATRTLASTPLVIAAATQKESASAQDTLSLLGWRYGKQSSHSLVVIDMGDTLISDMTNRAFAKSDLLSSIPVSKMQANSFEHAISLMKQHNIPALMLAVDAFSAPDVQVLQRFPPSVVKPAEFKAAVLAGEQMESARSFIRFLYSNSAKKHLSAYGLSSVNSK